MVLAVIWPNARLPLYAFRCHAILNVRVSVLSLLLSRLFVCLRNCGLQRIEIENNVHTLNFIYT